MSEPESISRTLHAVLDREPGLAELLEQSLTSARKWAEAELRPDLFAALEWPGTIEEYQDYVERFLRWVPRESGDDAWKKRDSDEEVDDREAHFYFLVSQKTGEKAPQDSEVFRAWMTEFTKRWGDFLDSPESFSPEVLQTFIDYSPRYRVWESLVDGAPNAPSGWLTANQFIARELNGGLRPIAEPDTNLVVTRPADCSFKAAYDVDADSNIPAAAVKKAKYGNIRQLIEGSAYADSFADGTFVHYMLPMHAYHRFHLPVAGRVAESFRIEGKVFMPVGIEDGQLQGIDDSTTGYEFSQTRGVVTLDTAGSEAGDIGLVAVIPVGMGHVSSVVLTATEDRHMAKGEEFGFFQFGGSDIILVFQQGVEVEIDRDQEFRFFGTPVARCRVR
ncbi:phosphatidylserine decarboxylase [Mycobacterium sp. 1274756.6]|uniref:phosphatidylserine decarboxylase n=1 Tax=Mycobacterium sp. 1274756.6 TaxID=1834076 RepID=UPI0007FFAA4D|nr:phosphatidylserine decarboxylase [Mycobacterium sp. 1274756.6]OBJ67958.1 phosphatidylserine decarboxylase [Mycobacterium sp. 1274756.6]